MLIEFNKISPNVDYGTEYDGMPKSWDLRQPKSKQGANTLAEPGGRAEKTSLHYVLEGQIASYYRTVSNQAPYAINVDAVAESYLKVGGICCLVL